MSSSNTPSGPSSVASAPGGADHTSGGKQRRSRRGGEPGGARGGRFAPGSVGQDPPHQDVRDPKEDADAHTHNQSQRDDERGDRTGRRAGPGLVALRLP